jgi:hypothetical protein
LPVGRDGAEVRVVCRGLRAWLAPGTALAATIGPDGDPDSLLTGRDCTIVKMQRKVVVGRVVTAAGALYVKRYNVFAVRVALGSFGRASPALAAWRAARTLGRLGFATAEPVAAIEFRRAGFLGKSFLVTRPVEGAVRADERWQAILADPDTARRRVARRALARALGDLFRRLHAAGVYHNDLKDANILVGGPPGSPACVLLDLERVRVGAPVGERRRRKNLVQLERTLGRRASRADRLRFLDAYLAPDRNARRAVLRHWSAAVAAGAARKDLRRARPEPPAGRRPQVSAMVVCQDEERHIAQCLESLAWCDELVVIDGGSHDRTPEIARRFTQRVVTNPWPGHRAQKQFGVEVARGEWVLNVDADERVTPELASEVVAALARVPGHVDGFAIPRLVCYLGRWWQRGALHPRWVLRLVRRSAVRWGGVDPHERAQVAGRVGRLRAPLLHYTYVDMADHVRSANRLTTVAAHSPRGRGGVGAGRLVIVPAWYFFRSWVLQRGCLDGLPGLFVAATAAFYAWLRAAKVWEAEGGGAGHA